MHKETEYFNHLDTIIISLKAMQSKFSSRTPTNITFFPITKKANINNQKSSLKYFNELHDIIGMIKIKNTLSTYDFDKFKKIKSCISWYLQFDEACKLLLQPVLTIIDFANLLTKVSANQSLTEDEINLLLDIEIINATNKNFLRNYLSEQFNSLLINDRFITYLPGYLNYGSVTVERTKIVLNRIQQITTSI